MALRTVAAFLLAALAVFGSARAQEAPKVLAWDQDGDAVIFFMDSQLWCRNTPDDVVWRDLVVEDRTEPVRYEGCWTILPDRATLRVYVHPIGWGRRPVEGLEFKKPPPYPPNMTPNAPTGAPDVSPTARPA